MIKISRMLRGSIILSLGAASVGFANTARNELAGEWQSNCVAKEFGAIRTSLRFNANQMSGAYNQSFKENCDEVHVTAKWTASYATSQSIKANVTKGINFRISSFTLTPVTADAAEALNSFALCGISNWQAGKAVQVAGRECPPLQQFPAAGTLVYNIYRLNGNQMLMGDVSKKGVGTSEATRPKALDETTIFQRVSSRRR